MANSETITVALSQDTVAAIRAAVASGDYASPDEVVRDALRDWKLKQRLASAGIDELRRLVAEGVDSGPAIDAELVFSRLMAKYAGMTQE